MLSVINTHRHENGVSMCAPYLIVPPWLMSGGAGSGETTAGRLLMISHVNGLVFDPAVFVRPGERFWIDGGTLHVEAPGRGSRQIPGWRSDRIPGELRGGFKNPDRSQDCGFCRPREERGYTRHRPAC